MLCKEVGIRAQVASTRLDRADIPTARCLDWPVDAPPAPFAGRFLPRPPAITHCTVPACDVRRLVAMPVPDARHGLPLAHTKPPRVHKGARVPDALVEAHPPTTRTEIAIKPCLVLLHERGSNTNREQRCFVASSLIASHTHCNEELEVARDGVLEEARPLVYH